MDVKQAAAGAFKSITEAVLSWQTLHNNGLAADILQILRAHKADLEDRGQVSTPTTCLLHALHPPLLDGAVIWPRCSPLRHSIARPDVER